MANRAIAVGELLREQAMYLAQTRHGREPERALLAIIGQRPRQCVARWRISGARKRLPSPNIEARTDQP